MEEKKRRQNVLRVYTRNPSLKFTKIAVLVSSSKTTTKVISKRFYGALTNDQNVVLGQKTSLSIKSRAT
jgi:hypothetical protein